MAVPHRLWLQRIALFLLAMILLVLAMEIGLRVLAFRTPSASGRIALDDPDAPTLLCVGDSHTYGVSVDAGMTYPAQLQAKLRSRGHRVNVLNLGTPGMNTSQIRRALPEYLLRYRPTAVLVLASVNNCWNLKDTDWADVQDRLPVSPGRKIMVALQSHSRLARGIGLLLHYGSASSSGGATTVVTNREGARVLHEKHALWDRPEDQRNLAISGMHRALRDLKAIINLIRESHATPVLLTYVAPTDENFSDQNMALRWTAREYRVLMADNDKALRPVFTMENGPSEPEVRHLFQTDLHLTAAGYSLVSDHLLQCLEADALLNQPGFSDPDRNPTHKP
jgi:lysophospholipase L1-like esterase